MSRMTQNTQVGRAGALTLRPCLPQTYRATRSIFRAQRSPENLWNSHRFTAVEKYKNLAAASVDPPVHLKGVGTGQRSGEDSPKAGGFEFTAT